MKYSFSIQIQRYVFKFLSKSFRAFKILTDLAKSFPIVLCYHSVSSDNWEYSISPENFEKQIRLLREMDKVFVTPSQIVGKYPIPKNSVAITFDDGFRDVFRNAFPILKKYKLSGTVFICEKSTKITHNCGIRKKLLNDSQIKILKKSGWEIGYHSASHCDLSKQPPAALKEQLIDVREKLENELGIKLEYFAYPYGLYSKKVEKILKAENYKGAFLADGGFVRNRHNPYKLNRIIVSKFNEEYFDFLITPIGIYFTRFINLLFRFKQKIFSKI